MSWTHAELPHVGKTVQRLGLAPNYGIGADDIPWAAERGFNLWFWSVIGRFGATTEPLRALLARERDRHVIVVGGGGYWPWTVRWSVENARKRLGVDQIDLFLLSWLGVTSSYTPGIVEALLAEKAAGRVKAVGTSVHDRPRAGRLAEDSVLDAFMLRYNAAHPGAEAEIFPHLDRRRPAVIAYTATSWRQLLKPGVDAPPWPGREVGARVPPMTAALCYRFQLQNPHVHAAWTGPGSRAQLEENLRALADGPLEPEEEAWIRAYGRAVGKKQPFGAG